MLQQPEIYYGSPEPLPEAYNLQAGPLSLLFEDGVVRYLRVAGQDVLWQIYAAVRDENWGTVKGVLSDVRLERRDDSFELSFKSTHETERVHFVWSGHIVGQPDGSLSFSFDGAAKSSFERNRIGFCVLHPATLTGTRCRIEHTDGSTSEDAFPVAISPHQPFRDVRALSHPVTDDLWLRVTMEGDTFETEDQRNWTDASFKTYCTPLDAPKPVVVEGGTKIRQRIRLELQGITPAIRVDNTPRALKFSEQHKDLANIGLGASETRLTAAETRLLRDLELSHIRVNLDLSSAFSDDLEQRTEEARMLGCDLELALYLSDDAEAGLEAFAKQLADLEPPIIRILLFGEHKTSLYASARRFLPGYTLAGGSDSNFTELNREPPDLSNLDQVCYAVTPQVHAFDNRSLVETLPMQALTAANAARLAQGKDVLISPITLRMRRLNKEAQSDPRQMSLFGAAWTLGSLKHLLASEASSLTYFEAVGPRGVLAGAKVPAAFPALSAAVYPMYHVFADIGEFRGGQIVGTYSSHPLQFEGLLLRKGNRERVMLANFTDEAQTLELVGLSGTFKVRVLDDTTAETALLEPATFRAGFPLSPEFESSSTVTLNPYGLMTLDRR